MADGLVQVQPDSTGKKVDTSELAVGANTVERQRINLADPAVAAALAAVLNAKPSTSDYGIVTREAPPARTQVVLYAEAVAGATSEALITLSQSKGFATATTGTSYSVTAGKTLRITAIIIAWVATTTTANTTRVRLRVNTAGAAALTSPIAFTARVGWESPTFIANETEFNIIALGDGLEIPAAAGLGVTHLEAAANGTIDITLIGYEY